MTTAAGRTNVLKQPREVVEQKASVFSNRSFQIFDQMIMERFEANV